MSIPVALIGVNDAEFAQLRPMFENAPNLDVVRRFPGFPIAEDLQRFCRALDPHLVFISGADPRQIEGAARVVLDSVPRGQMIFLDPGVSPETIRLAMRAGIRESLGEPLRPEEFREVLDRCLSRRLSSLPSGEATNALYAFLPAKAGVGASVLALQTALAMPADEGRRTLLIDADLDAGIQQFNLKIDNPHSLIHALERVLELDENLWPQLVATYGSLDVLQSGDAIDYQPDPARLHGVLEFSRRLYSTIFVDLPAAINRAAVEVMRQSRGTFLVTTTDLSSLHLARRRVRTLQDLQLAGQLQLLVTQVEPKSGPSLEEIQEMVGIPVKATFSADDPQVRRAILEHGRIPTARPLGKEIETFARVLARVAPLQHTQKKHRFLEIFAVAR